jgi:ribonuclease HI
MGIGWIIQHNNQNIEFKACTHKFPSSTRAELMAMLTVLTVIPKQTQVTIFCDSKAAIQGVQNILHNNVKACRNLKNIHILSNIQHISQTQQIQIKLTKVAAHTGIVGNETADKLAKSALESIHNIVEPAFTQNLPFTNITFWDDTPLEVPIKQGIK